MFRKSLILSSASVPAEPINGTCPHCNRSVSFNPIQGQVDSHLLDNETGEYYTAGQRICNSPGCRSHVFTLRNNDKLIVFPSHLPEIGVEGVPENISVIFNEALECSSNQNYRAAAMMIRRTLEELCSDMAATGDSLFERLKTLRDKVTLPSALFDAMKNVNLLSDDAASINADTYRRIDEGEIGVAIDFTHEILRAVYYYSEMLKAMDSLKGGKAGEE